MAENARAEETSSIREAEDLEHQVTEHSSQIEAMRLEQAQVAATLATLRSQRDSLLARLNSARTQTQSGDSVLVSTQATDRWKRLAVYASSALAAVMVIWILAGFSQPDVIDHELAGRMVLIPAGEFMMGSPESDPSAGHPEFPQHLVQISRPFYMGVHEVTFEEFRRFVTETGYDTTSPETGVEGAGYNPHSQQFERTPGAYSWRNPGYRQTSRFPVVNVSWHDANAYCEWLTQKDGEFVYRLPTEAEWEYACRAGSTTIRDFGDDPALLKDNANILDASAKAIFHSGDGRYQDAESWDDGCAFASPVGQFPSNDFGLHDMQGNVAEWCQDVFEIDRYLRPDDEPAVFGGLRVIRGGSWGWAAYRCRSAYRHRLKPEDRWCNLGFRIVREFEPGVAGHQASDRPEFISRRRVMNHSVWTAVVSGFILAGDFPVYAQEAELPNQYEADGIKVPAANADEPGVPLSIEKASQYLDHGAIAWSKQRNCVSCHTNGTYLFIRPSLTPTLGKPAEATRKFFVDQFERLSRIGVRKLRHSSIRPAQVIYIAAGFAEWDAHVTKQLSPETNKALRLVFEIQNDKGTWHSATCWPPFESSAYQEAHMAAMAVASAPGWLESLRVDDEVIGRIDLLKKYLREETLPHEYAKVLQLWTSLRLDGILNSEQQQQTVQLIRQKQKPDGGWSIRQFARPEQWGSGNRAAKLRKEPEFVTQPSDGHMTGLALVVLQEAGVPDDDPQIKRGLAWLRENQRESGRWWTRSLNTDKWHFITYSGTAYPLLALQHAESASK